MTHCDFSCLGLKRHCNFHFCFESWATKYRSPTSLTCWREMPGRERLRWFERVMRNIGSGSPIRFSYPSRITRHVHNTSLKSNQVAPAIMHETETSHYHWTLPTLQNYEQINSGCWFKPLEFWELYLLCCNRMWWGRVSRQGNKLKDLEQNPDVRWWVDKYRKKGKIRCGRTVGHTVLCNLVIGWGAKKKGK